MLGVFCVFVLGFFISKYSHILKKHLLLSVTLEGTILDAKLVFNGEKD